MLKRARGGRTLKEIAAGASISVPRYQNWEMGKNAPKRDVWPALSKALGVDVAAIYMGKPSAERPDQAIPAAAVRPLLTEIRQRLDALEAICGATSHQKPRAAKQQKA